MRDRRTSSAATAAAAELPAGEGGAPSLLEGLPRAASLLLLLVPAMACRGQGWVGVQGWPPAVGEQCPADGRVSEDG